MWQAMGQACKTCPPGQFFLGPAHTKISKKFTDLDGTACDIMFAYSVFHVQCSSLIQIIHIFCAKERKKKFKEGTIFHSISSQLEGAIIWIISLHRLWRTIPKRILSNVSLFSFGITRRSAKRSANGQEKQNTKACISKDEIKSFFFCVKTSQMQKSFRES